MDLYLDTAQAANWLSQYAPFQAKYMPDISGKLWQITTRWLATVNGAVSELELTTTDLIC